MGPLDILLLVTVGIVGGIISSIAGGAALFIFPALLATGLSPVVATAVNTAALTPSLLLAALYDRAQLPALDRAFVALVLIAILGGFVGAALLLLTPERTFTALVPLLLGFATVLFAYARRINAWLAARAAPSGELGSLHSLAAMLPVCVYGGYFGAGIGVLMLGILSVGTGGDYRSANVTKNLLTSLNSLAAVIIFTIQGVVAWLPTLVMIAGTLAGALIGARLAQTMSNEAARRLVITVGALLTAVFAWRYWL
jgi:uncharacterized membrane protein YfcA